MENIVRQRRNQKNRMIIFALGIFFLALCLRGGQSVKAASVSKISVSTKQKGGKAYYIIRAKNRAGKVVWKYKTKRYDLTELLPVTMKTKGNRVYVFEDGRMLVFHKQNGKRLLRTKKILKGWQAVFIVDSSGNCYVQAYYLDDVYKISPQGKVLWKRKIVKTKLYWPGKMEIRKNTVRVYYDGESPDPYADVTGKYIDFDKKTGKIRQYKGEDGTIKKTAETNNGKTTSRQAALKAYKKYLSAKEQKWGEYKTVKMSECEFALKDFDNDKIPELILLYPGASTADCFERVYTYQNGKVKELFSVYSGGIDKIYPAKGICVVSGIHTGRCWEYYYKISKGVCRLVLERHGSDSVKGHGGDFYYNRYYIGKKKVSKSKFLTYRKKLIGKSKNKKTYSYRKNTERNRKKYL